MHLLCGDSMTIFWIVTLTMWALHEKDCKDGKKINVREFNFKTTKNIIWMHLLCVEDHMTSDSIVYN